MLSAPGGRQALDAGRAYRVMVEAAHPFRAGTRFRALPDVRFLVEGGRIRTPGDLLPGPEDGTAEQYADRLDARLRGNGRLLAVEQPLLLDHALWAQVRDLVVPLWERIGHPVLPVVTELALGEGITDGDGLRREPVHAAPVWVLSGSVTAVPAREQDGPTTTARAGELLHWPAGRPHALRYGPRTLALRLLVPADARLLTEAVKDVVAGMLHERRGHDQVPYLSYPPPDAEARAPEVPELAETGAGLREVTGCGPARSGPACAVGAPGQRRRPGTGPGATAPDPPGSRRPAAPWVARRAHATRRGPGVDLGRRRPRLLPARHARRTDPGPAAQASAPTPWRTCAPRPRPAASTRSSPCWRNCTPCGVWTRSGGRTRHERGTDPGGRGGVLLGHPRRAVLGPAPGAVPVRDTGALRGVGGVPGRRGRQPRRARGRPYATKRAVHRRTRPTRRPPDGALPTDEDGSFDAYDARLAARLDGRRHALVVNGFHAFDPALWSRERAFFDPLWRAVGLPLTGAITTLFHGTYEHSPVGVHKDRFATFMFGLRGRKRMRFWPRRPWDEAVSTKTDYARHTAASVYADVGPGELLYWPADYYHVGESAGSAPRDQRERRRPPGRAPRGLRTRGPARRPRPGPARGPRRSRHVAGHTGHRPDRARPGPRGLLAPALPKALTTAVHALYEFAEPVAMGRRVTVVSPAPLDRGRLRARTARRPSPRPHGHGPAARRPAHAHTVGSGRTRRHRLRGERPRDPHLTRPPRAAPTDRRAVRARPRAGR